MTKRQPTASAATPDPLWDAFVDPPDDARPRVWWHWMDGNVDAAGIVRDLHWLHGVGVRGVQVFDGGMGGPSVVAAPVRPGTDAWDAAMQTAVRTASELGMEFAVATSSGWSAAGGPWVEPEDAMKKVVWSECVVEGGGPVDVVLPALPAVAGLYQDAPRWGAGVDDASFATDWRVLAFPADSSHTVLVPFRVAASARVDDWSALTDGSFSGGISLPRDPDGWSTAWIEQDFGEAVTVGSVVLGLPGPQGFGAAPAATAVLQASDDGVAYREIAELPAAATPARTASFPSVTARRFRVVLSGGSAAGALPPVLRTADTFEVSEFALRSAGRVHRAEAKAGFGVVADYFAVGTDPQVQAGVVDPRTVVDVTAHVQDGTLRWNAPPGRWSVLRLGASLTGQTNGPAPADATGLEVDKLDGDRVRTYLDTHLGRFVADGRRPEGAGIGALLSDSIEAGPQNWTDAMLDQFIRRRGYDALAFLPALAGYLVGGALDSDRFLFDYRRTIADLLASEYYGTLAAEAHGRGLKYYAEALEDGRPQLGDDLAMRSHADVPMGAMWTFDPDEGPRPTYVADLKGASSVAHVYGKERVGAEAFTSFDQPWSWTPRTLKHVADLQSSLGVTRFCIHSSPHQPLAVPPPGIALAPFLGQAFTITETWSSMAAPWIDYLARCSAVLGMGAPAVDIAVFVGEEAPVTGLFEHVPDASVPAGFDFDYVGADALREVLQVESGDIVARGARYRLLALGGSSERMTLQSLIALERLLDAGATVVGLPPTASPSLADDPAEFAAARARIWALPRTSGRVLATADLSAAVTELGIRPAVVVDGPSVRRIARDVGDRRVTFLSNPSAAPIELRVEVAEPTPLIAWDPVEVSAVPLRPVASGAGGRGSAYAVSLQPFGSVFVVPSSIAPAEPLRSEPIPLAGDWALTLPDRPSVSLAPHPRLWTELDDRARGFSGVGTYRLEFTLSAAQLAGDRLILELGQVRDIARVTVNGRECGVAWTSPFRVDVTTAVGLDNVLEVEVATPWRNRLIAEASGPTGEIFAPMTSVFEPTARPLPAGLAGPVAIIAESSPR
ncbi:MAG: glycosyl hydrolase [Leifsonia sp.]